MSDVFISYANNDRETARRLAEAIAEHGHTVWWDRNIPPGRTFDEVIQKALAEAKCVVALWSKSSIASNWVKAEADEAAKRDILVPVFIENVTAPFEFRRIHAANLVGWSGDRSSPEFQSILAAIAHTTQNPGTSPRRTAAPRRGAAILLLALLIGAPLAANALRPIVGCHSVFSLLGITSLAVPLLTLFVVLTMASRLGGQRVATWEIPRLGDAPILKVTGPLGIVACILLLIPLWKCGLPEPVAAASLAFSEQQKRIQDVRDQIVVLEEGLMVSRKQFAEIPERLFDGECRIDPQSGKKSEGCNTTRLNPAREPLESAIREQEKKLYVMRAQEKRESDRLSEAATRLQAVSEQYGVPIPDQPR